MNCWVCLWPLCVTKVSSEGMSQAFKPRGLGSWAVALWLSHLFFCAQIPLLTLNEKHLKYIGEKERRTGQLNTNSVSATYYIWLFGYCSNTTPATLDKCFLCRCPKYDFLTFSALVQWRWREPDNCLKRFQCDALVSMPLNWTLQSEQ